MTQWCNAYGGEYAGPSEVRNLGGLGRAPDQKGDTNWHCDRPKVGRFRMICDHGHTGPIVPLCEKHRAEFWDSITFCPRCNTEPPGHKCQVTMFHVS
jgi:hypothetical protein